MWALLLAVAVSTYELRVIYFVLYTLVPLVMAGLNAGGLQSKLLITPLSE